MTHRSTDPANQTCLRRTCLRRPLRPLSNLCGDGRLICGRRSRCGRRGRLAIIALLLVTAPAATSHAADQQLDASVQQALQTAAPSTVRIRVVGSGENSGQAVTSQTTTGVVLSEAGLIMTSVFGFTSKPTAIFVENGAGERVAARLVATDFVRKLVLLQTEPGVFPPARFASRRWPVVGEYAIAAGRLYPGKTPSASVGIVSAVKRIHELAFQTDAKISPVNYGGPVLNLNGEVTGILVPLSPRETGSGINAGVEWYDSGIGFAIPAADLPEVVRSLKTGRDRTRGYLGIRPATENPLSSDVRITTVSPGSPAADAGLKVDDRIVAVNEIPISRYGELESIMKRSYANDLLTFRVNRSGREVDVELQLAEQLIAPAPGYLGLIPIDVEESGEEKRVRAAILPGSPLADQFDEQTILVSRWNESTKVTSRARLKRLLGELVKDRAVQIEYEDDGGATQTLEVLPGPRPAELPTISTELIEQIIAADAAADWQTFEESIGDDGGRVWGFGPQEKKTPATGVAILLGASTVPKEAVLNRWKSVCRQHKLMLVVPVNAEQTALTREDKSLVIDAFQKSAFGRTLDVDRICLVADQSVAELATEILMDPEARVFEAATYVETWPRTTGIPSEAISEKPPKLLILNGVIQSRTAQALRTQALNRVSTGGGSVIQSDMTNFPSIEDAIALWCLSLKAR